MAIVGDGDWRIGRIGQWAREKSARYEQSQSDPNDSILGV